MLKLFEAFGELVVGVAKFAFVIIALILGAAMLAVLMG